MRLEKIINVTPFGIFFLFVTIPMLSLYGDMWDGTIIEYASFIGDFSGLKAYFFESGWLLQYPLSIAIIEISQFLNISYKNTNALVVLAMMFVFLRETLWLAEHKIKLSKPAAYFATALLSTFSTWGVLLSSIMTLHFACMAIGLLSVRLIHNKAITSKLIGFAALPISLSLQSQLVFLPVLSYIYDLSERNRVGQSFFAYPSKQTALIFGICILFYSVIQSFYPPHGLYENYNNLVIENLDGLAIAIGSSIAMVTFLIPIFLVVGCISLLALMVNDKVTTPRKEHVSHNPNWFVWLLVLFFAGLFPYAAVGKSSMLLGIGDWSSRQAFLLALPTCLFTAFCLQHLYEKFSTKLIRNCVLICGALIFLLHSMLLITDVGHKSNRQIFDSQLEKIIRDNEDKLPPGLIEIVGSNIPNPTIRVFELNLLMYRATGKAVWWTRVGSKLDKSFSIPCHIRLNRDYQLKYIFNYKPEYLTHSVIEIKTSGFRGLLNVIRNLLGINPPGSVELMRIHSKSEEITLNNESCN